jgi:hypothetical protein
VTTLLVPIALDVLVVREQTPVAKTALQLPAIPSTAQHKQVLPDPFAPDDQRAPGAYLSFSLPDGLTHAPAGSSGSNPFPPIPERWLILRLTGDITAGPRTVSAWLIADVNAQPPSVTVNALTQPWAAVTSPPVHPLTVLGTGDLSWSGYFDNVRNILGLYDDLSGVSGSVSYLVCGWYTHSQFDPLTGATSDDLLAAYGWRLPDGVDTTTAPVATAVLCHGAAVALGWPTAAWPGDGGALSAETGGPPDPAQIGVALADTIAEATAAMTAGDGADPTDQLLVQATIAGMLAQLAQVDGPATLDTALHTSRFNSQASDDTSETIWDPNAPPPAASNGAPAAATRRAALERGPAAPVGGAEKVAGLGGGGLAEALAASRGLASRTRPAAASEDTTDPTGALVAARRSQPRVFSPVDPVIVLSGAGRSFTHGADGRDSADGKLMCRLSGSTITWAGAAGTVAPDPAIVLPAGVQSQLSAQGAPGDVFSLLLETACLDPSGAPDLAAATATAPSPDSAARAGWLQDPSQTPPAVVGTLPSPIGVTGPTRPWTPMHVEWELSWQAAADGIHGFTLGAVDFDTPESGSLPATRPAVPIQGRSRLTAAPGAITAGGAAQALAHLDAAGLLGEHAFADRLSAAVTPLAAAGGRAIHTGAVGALADQDLLSGSLEAFLATLRGETTDPVLGPSGSTSATTTRPTVSDPMRAGLVSLTRARVVDCFGQYMYLAGSTAATSADPSRVQIGAAEAIDGDPGVMLLVPRFNAPARVMLRYVSADGSRRDADTAISPVCGFVLPSPIDGSLEFFGADGAALGRLRPDQTLGTVWEEDPGQPASLGRRPSESIPNQFLGEFADNLVAFDIAQAAAGAPAGTQTGLMALNLLIDATRWTKDTSGSSGDEHLSLLLGHPIAVLRAGIKLDVQYSGPDSTAPFTQVPVKLGTLAHTQDGLLAYFVADDYSRVRPVDPQSATSLGTVARASPRPTSRWARPSPSSRAPAST